jgi:hypothetical protein
MLGYQVMLIDAKTQQGANKVAVLNLQSPTSIRYLDVNPHFSGGVQFTADGKDNRERRGQHLGTAARWGLPDIGLRTSLPILFPRSTGRQMGENLSCYATTRCQTWFSCKNQSRKNTRPDRRPMNRIYIGRESKLRGM